MVAFEPSTWAEVEEAEAMGKASLRATNPLVTDIVRFTSAPERCITASFSADDSATGTTAPARPLSPISEAARPADKADGEPPAPAETPHPNARYNIPPQRLIRPKRNNMHFEDLLRLGRVNLQTNALARWRNATSNTTFFERSLAADAAKDIAILPSPVNPSSALFNPDVYLAKVHAETSRSDLAQGLKNLSNLISLIDNQADELRMKSYPSVCLVAAELENTRRLIGEQEAEGRPAKDNSKLFAGAETTLKEKYSVVLQREQEIEQLQRVLAVVKRFEWVFTLGSRMKNSKNSPTEVIESLAREFARGREWLDSQDPDTVVRIARDMEEGIDSLAANLTERLGNSKTSRMQMKRIVSILASIDCEGSIRQAMEYRMEQANEKLDVASRVDPTNFEDEDAELGCVSFVKATTVAFISGLSTYWRLACVVSLYETCSVHVYHSLPALIERYVTIVQNVFSKGAAVLSREVVSEVKRAHSVCLLQLKIPQDYMSSLLSLTTKVATEFVSSTAHAVESSAHQIALDVMRDRSAASEAASFVQFVVFEALSQVQDILQKPVAARNGSSKGDAGKLGIDYLRGRNPDENDSISVSVTTLKDSCMGALATTAQVLEESLGQLGDSSVDPGSHALHVAVFCVKSKASALSAVHDQICHVLGEDGVAEKYDSAHAVIDQVRAVSVQDFVRSVAPFLEKIGARIVSYPNRSGSEKGTRLQNWRIKTVSPQAPELVLELALSAMDTRRRGADAQVVYEVTKELISRVGNAIAAKAKAAKLRPEHAAQVWVDCSYIANVVSSSIPAEGDERYMILNGFTEAMQAARSMLAAEGHRVDDFQSQALTDSAISPAVDDAEILRRCLSGDGSLVRSKEEV